MTRLPTNRWTRHGLFWAGILVFYGVISIINPKFCFCNLDVFLADLLLASLPILLFYTYLIAYGLLPFVFRRQFGWFVVGLLVANLVSWLLYDPLNYGVYYLITHWFGQKLPERTEIWQVRLALPGNNFRNTNLVAGLFVCLKLFKQWQQKQLESQRLESEKIRTDLQLLKLQLNPVFLFGILTTLHQLTRQQSMQAPEVVLRLAHFLRYVLYESQADRVPLSWETDVIEQYVWLQRTIHPANLEVSLTIRGNLADHQIPPLLLFSIVAAAFRQLTPEPPSEPAWVSIDLAITDTYLMLKVINGQNVPQPDEVDGLGDVRKQVQFYYAETADLQVLSEPDAHIVSLMLPLTGSPQPDWEAEQQREVAG